MRRYPRIAHLDGSRACRGDLILSPRKSAEVLASPGFVFEKLDGLNVGVRFRGPGRPVLLSRAHGEVRPIDVGPDLFSLCTWVLRRLPSLWGLLGTEDALFGEWVERRLGVAYEHLPDWFIFFDLFHIPSQRLYSPRVAQARIEAAGFVFNRPRFAGVAGDLRWPSSSRFGTNRVEGWVVRTQGGRTAKFVQADHAWLEARRLGEARNALASSSRILIEKCPL